MKKLVIFSVMALLSLALLASSVFASPHFSSSEEEEATQETTAQAASQAIVAAVSTRISQTFAAGFAKGTTTTAANGLKTYTSTDIGMNSGDDAGFGVWGVGSFTSFENSYTPRESDGNIATFMAGVDTTYLGGDLLTGVSLGYENSDVSLKFSGANIDTDGYTIAPYVAYGFADGWSVDGLVAYTFQHARKTAGTTTGSFDGERTMISTNLNYAMPYDKWIFTYTLGNLYVNSYSEDYRDSTDTAHDRYSTYLGEMRLGVRADYNFNDMMTPFVGLAYLYDYTMKSEGTTHNDEDAFELTAGLDFYNQKGLTIGIDGATTLLREDITNNRVGCFLRYDF
ncbi:MAG: autotransporter outer membrane beta-barrel domain-containing protein [Desulfovibrio sp.]